MYDFFQLSNDVGYSIIPGCYSETFVHRELSTINYTNMFPSRSGQEFNEQNS